MGNRSRNKDRRIVKVQLSIVTTTAKQQILVYDKSRKWRFQGDATPDQIAMMNGRVKAFFWARKEGPMLDIQTNMACPEQDW